MFKRKDALVTPKTATALDDLLSLFPNALRALCLLTALGLAVQLARNSEPDLSRALKTAFLLTVAIEVARWVLWPWLERLSHRDLDHSGQVGDFPSFPPARTVEKQLVRIHTPRLTIEGVDADDLAEFIRGLPWRLVRREWTHEDVEDMPPYAFASGRLCDQAYFAQLVSIIERNGWIDRGRGKAPRLLVDPTVMLQELGLPTTTRGNPWHPR